MRYLKRLLPTLLAGILVAGAASGCVVRGRTHGSVTYSTGYAPPAPRYAYVAPRSGHVWIEGYWYHNGYDWIWIDGYWERHRPGYAYVQGSWYVSGGKHHWRPGHWSRSSDGRGYQYQRNNGVVTREHPARNHGTVHRVAPARGKVVRES